MILVLSSLIHLSNTGWVCSLQHCDSHDLAVTENMYRREDEYFSNDKFKYIEYIKFRNVYLQLI